MRTACVAGVFRDRESAGDAVANLAASGLDRDAVGVMTDLPDELRSDDDAGPDARGRGLAAGAVLGAVGGIALEATVLAFPGAGPFLTGGALAAALLGGSAGAAAGALSATLVRLGLRDHDASAIERLLGSGAVVVTVGTEDRVAQERARTVLRAAGAVFTTSGGDTEETTNFIRGFAEYVGPLREHFERAYAPRGDDWATWEPRYRYGWQLANRPDMAGRTWDDAVSDIQGEWERRHPEVPWDVAAAAIERGWRSKAEEDEALTADRARAADRAR